MHVDNASSQTALSAKDFDAEQTPAFENPKHSPELTPQKCSTQKN
jgi:hypothetical protein